jgi:hypothetical protein
MRDWQEASMILRGAGFAGLAVACALLLGAPQPVRAQVSDQQTTRDQTTTTTTQTHSEYESPSWQAPRGYEEAYPENGTPNMVARQGYAAGFNQGQADASRGKKFQPTEADAYEHAQAPKGMSKDAFRQAFREAYVKGYTNGYKATS